MAATINYHNQAAIYNNHRLLPMATIAITTTVTTQDSDITRTTRKQHRETLFSKHMHMHVSPRQLTAITKQLRQLELSIATR